MGLQSRIRNNPLYWFLCVSRHRSLRSKEYSFIRVSSWPGYIRHIGAAPGAIELERPRRRYRDPAAFAHNSTPFAVLVGFAAYDRPFHLGYVGADPVDIPPGAGLVDAVPDRIKAVAVPAGSVAVGAVPYTSMIRIRRDHLLRLHQRRLLSPCGVRRPPGLL